MSKPTDAATFESRAYENARQRDAVIAVMHRMKRWRESHRTAAMDVPESEARYHDGSGNMATRAIEELRKALCLPVDWETT